MNLAGAFRGLGVGLTQVGKYQLDQQAEERKDQVLLDRQTALADLQARKAESLASTQHDYRMTEIQKTADATAQAHIDEANGVAPIKNAERHDQQGFQVRLTYIQGKIARDNSAASIQLQHDLDSGNVTDIKPGGDGTYYIVKKDGTMSATGVAAPPPTESGQSGMASVNFQRNKALFDDALSQWNIEGKKAGLPRPKLSDFLADSGSTPASAQTAEKRTYTMRDFNETLAAAAADARYKGMPADQIRQLVKQRFADSGYTLTQ